MLERPLTMANVSVARRYARALLEVASEASRLDSVGTQLNTLAAILEKNRELAELLSDPSYTRPQRLAVIQSVMAEQKLDEPALQNLVKLLVDRNRMRSLPDMARVYQSLADARAGRLRGELRSARPLAPEAVKKVESTLERITQRKVTLESRVDPSLLGGVAAQVGSVVYDGTLRTQLDELRRSLT